MSYSSKKSGFELAFSSWQSLKLFAMIMVPFVRIVVAKKIDRTGFISISSSFCLLSSLSRRNIQTPERD